MASASSSNSEPIRDGIWRGRRCFIVGGGPSLSGFDWSRLRGELTIGINRAFEFFDPTIILSIDSRFLDWLHHGRFGETAERKFRAYDRGLRLYLDTTRKKESRWSGVEPLACIGTDGWGESIATGIASGHNSGFAALNLAWCLGADPIYLLGFDMQGDTSPRGQQKWFHSGYPTVQPATVYSRFMKAFEDHAAPAIAQSGRRVVNMNPKSALRCFEFAEGPWSIAPEPMPLIVAYYTKGTGYEQEAENLRRSLLPFGLDHLIAPVASLGSWQKNTQFKARFLLEMMERHPGRPLLYVDADATIERYPALLQGLDADIAVHHRRGKELLSGTIYLSGSQKCRETVERWIHMCAERPDVWDQKCLDFTLREDFGAKVAELPADYCAIFDLMPEAQDPVIKHWQASRRLKKEVNAA